MLYTTLLLFSWLATSPPDKQLIASVEKDFYKHLRLVDKEYHHNFTAQFKRIFQRQHSSPYQLHRELVLIDRKSEPEAKRQAAAHGYKEREYTRYIGDIRSNYRAILMNRYRMSIDQRTAFENNYCFCYSGKVDSYCSEGKCKLDSSF